MFFLKQHAEDRDMYDLYRVSVNQNVTLIAIIFVDHAHDLLGDEDNAYAKLKSGKAVQVKLSAA